MKDVADTVVLGVKSQRRIKNPVTREHSVNPVFIRRERLLKLLKEGFYLRPEEDGRLREAFQRFMQVGGTEVHVDDLHDVIQHLGYIDAPEDDLKELIDEVTKYNTLSHEELAHFMQRYAVYELQRFGDAFDKRDQDRLGEGELEGFLWSIGFTPLRAGLKEAKECLEESFERGISLSQFCNIMAVYRSTEGFTCEEVIKIRRTYGCFAESPETKGGTGDHAVLQQARLGAALLNLFGPQTAPLVERLTRKFAVSGGALQDNVDKAMTGKDQPALSFPEFLVWARRLREAEVQEYRRQFTLFDEDHSNKIDSREFTSILRHLGYTPLQNVVREMLDELDIDHDGELDLDQFIQLMELFRARDGFTEDELSELRNAYVQFDRDGDNEVTALELMELLRYLGHTSKLDEVHNYIAQVDQDSSGNLDFQEFLRLMRIHRERELRDTLCVFEKFKDRLTERLPSSSVQTCLTILRCRLDWNTLACMLIAQEDPNWLSFEEFVSIMDRCRRVLVVARRKQAGFSDEEIRFFRELFHQYDEDGSGTIEKQELMSLLQDLQIPMRTVAQRNSVLSMLDRARESAVESGVESKEEAVFFNSIKNPIVSFWVMVHLLRMVRARNDEEELAEEEKTIEEVGFNVQEVAEFREIFQRCAQRGDLEDMEPQRRRPMSMSSSFGDRSSKRKIDASANPFAATSEPRLVFTLNGATRVFLSFGLRLNALQTVKLEEQLRLLGAERYGGLTFSGFLRLMRWMIDSNFANVNEVAATVAARRKREAEAAMQHGLLQSL